MTNEEIVKYKNDLKQIVNRSNEIKGFSLSSAQGLKDANGKLDNILNDITSLAEKVGASTSIGTGWFLIEKYYSDAKDVTALDIGEKDIKAKKEVITELIFGINNALQTETMVNACVSAEQSSTTAKGACIWAAVAAILAFISIVVMLCIR
jgi:hypothetical protein